MRTSLFNVLILYLSSLFIQINTVNAEEVTLLDQSLVPVKSRSVAERNKAISLALQNVVLKNAGSVTALNNPSIMAKIKSPNSLIRQFGYDEIDGKLFLKVNFDHKRIISLLREVKLPVWGKQRPLTLIWLVEEINGDRQIVNDSSLLDTRQFFKHEAETKGVPLLFPLMDLDDNMQISVNDVRGMFVAQVDTASQRYQTDYFVLASMSPSADGVELSVSLFVKGSEQQGGIPLVSKWQVVTDTRAAVTEIISSISDYYVGRYAITDTGVQLNSSVTFVDITEMKQLVAIEKYLNQLSAVKAVNVSQLQGTSVQYHLSLFGTLDDLHRLMVLDPRVMETKSGYQSKHDSSDTGSVQFKELEYHWCD